MSRLVGPGGRSTGLAGAWSALLFRSGAIAFTVALGMAASPAIAAGQEGTGDQRVAQLEARVAELEASVEELRAGYASRLAELEQRFVSLQADLAGQGALAEAAAADEAEPGEAEQTELEAAVERALAGIEADEPATGAGAVAPDDRTFDDRARNLNAMNPEISVTGDMFGSVSDHSGDPTTNRFQIASFEISFQSALDPFSKAAAFVVFEDGAFDLEEMYMDWSTLPAGLGLKVGAFRNDFGKINRWHQHALQQADRPLAHRVFFGDEGLRGLGVSVSWLPGPFLGDYNEFWVQVTNDDNEAAFSGRGFETPIITVHETNYWDLSAASYFEIGFSASTGVNDEFGEHRTTIYSTDINYSWSPPAEALYKGFDLRGEVLYARRGSATGTRGSWGAYLYGTRKLGQRWSAGMRVDWSELPDEPGQEIWGVSPYIEYWQSEWARLRFQYSHSSRLIEENRADNRFFFQVTWAIGPHKHENY